MDLKEMGCDDVDHINWLLSEEDEKPLGSTQGNFRIKVTTIFSITNLPRELN